MSTFQGHNPETRISHSGKSQPSQKKLRKISDAVEVQVIEDDDDDTSMYYLMEDTSKQLVLYNPKITHEKKSTVEATKPIHHSTPNRRYGYDTVLPSIGAYTVQCAHCFKWRVVPTKQKYEELRETISEELFVCTRAHEWNRVLSCDDPEDISQDGSRVWALDKPNIAQPPPGWDREVRIRGEGCSKFADVYAAVPFLAFAIMPAKRVNIEMHVYLFSPFRYYTSPSGRKLRSSVEIGRYLAENPHYIQEGVNLSQFSFATPRPLQEDYIKKRSYAAACEFPELPEPVEVNPLCWAAPPTRRELLELGTSASNPVDLDLDQPTSASDPTDQPEMFKPPARRTKKRTVKQASPPSSESKKRSVKQASPPSSESKKRSVKQASPPSSESKKRSVKQASPPSSESKKGSVKQASPPSSESKKRSVKQASPPSSGSKKRTLKQAPRPSSDPRKRTPKQTPTPTRHHSAAPPGGDIEHVLL